MKKSARIILAALCVFTHFRLVKVTQKYYCQG